MVEMQWHAGKDAKNFICITELPTSDASKTVLTGDSIHVYWLC
jgi:hypothetical protein